MNKQCSICKEILDYSNFSKNKYKNDGYSSECKPCFLKLNYRVDCECGVKIRKYYKKYHEKTLIHDKNLVYKRHIASL